MLLLVYRNPANNGTKNWLRASGSNMHYGVWWAPTRSRLDRRPPRCSRHQPQLLQGEVEVAQGEDPVAPRQLGVERIDLQLSRRRPVDPDALDALAVGAVQLGALAGVQLVALDLEEGTGLGPLVRRDLLAEHQPGLDRRLIGTGVLLEQDQVGLVANRHAHVTVVEPDPDRVHANPVTVLCHGVALGPHLDDGLGLGVGRHHRRRRDLHGTGRHHRRHEQRHGCHGCQECQDGPAYGHVLIPLPRRGWSTAYKLYHSQCYL